MKYYAKAFNEMNEDEISTNDFYEIREFVRCYGKHSNNVVIVREYGKEIFYKEVGSRKIYG